LTGRRRRQPPANRFVLSAANAASRAHASNRKTARALQRLAIAQSHAELVPTGRRRCWAAAAAARRRLAAFARAGAAADQKSG
jgi:hypothetical protein